MEQFRSYNQGGRSGGFRGGFGGRSGGSRGSFGGDRRGGFGGRSGGRGGFGGGRGRDSRRSGERPEMFDATCAKCGKPCQVPFRPTGEKPVLCSDCFRTGEGSSQRGNFNSKGSGSQSGVSQEQVNKLNAKLDKIIEILETLEIEVEEAEDDSDIVEDANESEDSESKDKEESSDEDSESDL